MNKSLIRYEIWWVISLTFSLGNISPYLMLMRVLSLMYQLIIFVKWEELTIIVFREVDSSLDRHSIVCPTAILWVSKVLERVCMHIDCKCPDSYQQGVRVWAQSNELLVHSWVTDRRWYWCYVQPWFWVLQPLFHRGSSSLGWKLNMKIPYTCMLYALIVN